MQPRLEFDLLEAWSIIKQNKRTIVYLTLFFLLGVFAASALTPKMYKAKATLVSLADEPDVLKLSDMANSPKLERPKIATVLSSRRITEQVVIKLQLERSLFPEKYVRADEKQRKGLFSAAVNKVDKATVREMNDNLISVVTLWKDPQIASNIANAYVEYFNQILNSKSLAVACRVLDQAEPPLESCSFNMLDILLIALIPGIFLSVLVCLLNVFLVRVRNEY